MSQPDICIIFYKGSEIQVAIELNGSLWDRTHHMNCIRHIWSNYMGRYHKDAERQHVINIGTL